MYEVNVMYFFILFSLLQTVRHFSCTFQKVVEESSPAFSESLHLRRMEGKKCITEKVHCTFMPPSMPCAVTKRFIRLIFLRVIIECL